MSFRIRGQEALVQINVDGQPQVGSFLKVRDLRITPRMDLMEESYLNEAADDLDIQHHGYDFSFTVDNIDDETLKFLDNIVLREFAHISHPNIVMSVTYSYREPGTTNRTELFMDIVMKISEQSIGGRKEYVQTSFEGKAKTKLLLTAPV